MLWLFAFIVILSIPAKAQEKERFEATSAFLDAAIHSLGSIQGLINKENYRVRLSSFHNPASNDLGFNLENEIQKALKPLLSKAKSTNSTRFSEVVNTLLFNQGPPTIGRVAVTSLSPAFSSLLGLVGNLAVQEKKITRQDLDSFVQSISRYFVQYQKLYNSNLAFDKDLVSLEHKLKELQFDLKKFMADLIRVLYSPSLKIKDPENAEMVFLEYLDRQPIQKLKIGDNPFIFPSDAINRAREFAHNLIKLSEEYERIYTNNYNEVRAILLQSKELSRGGEKNLQNSLEELEKLYKESLISDGISLRLKTLEKRLEELSDLDVIKKAD